MNNYYMNKNSQSNGDNEVHKSTCAWLPHETNRLYLGLFSDCKQAIKKALAYDKDADGCKHCSPACHTR